MRKRGVIKGKEKDEWGRLGSALIVMGVSAWIFYAAARYGLDLDITGEDALPYHLAGVIPGFLLKRRRFLLRLLGREKDKRPPSNLP